VTAVLLEGLVAAPAALAVLVGLLAPRRSRAGVGLAAAGAAALLAWSVWAVVAVPADDAVDRVWVGALEVHWHLALDGISAPLVLLTTLVTACCAVSLLRHPPAGGEPAGLAALLLLIEAGVLGAFLARDMVLFFVFFEVALVPMWFVIQRWGDPADEAGRRRAATRFLVFTVLGSALMLVGFVLSRTATGTFDIDAVAAQGAPEGPVAVGAAVLVGLGLAVKTPLWPVHIWLPDAHAKAPTVGSVVLAALLLKLGTYGFVRFWLPLTDPGWDPLLPTVAALATVGIVYGALACLAQTDLKRLVAYSSVGHMGFVVLGVATYTVGGVQAAVYASVAHGLVTGLLFFLAGAVKDRCGTGDLRRLSALYGRVPHLGGLVAFAAMASLGLPGLAGFWGEMLAIRAAVFPRDGLPRETYLVLAVVAALGVILTSAYFLALMRGMLQGPRARPAESPGKPAVPEPPGLPRLADVSVMEWLAWSPLVVLTVVFGVAPGLLLTPVAEATAAFFAGGW
jgi:NADH-quinone oxidoreductase subunit M